MRSSRREFLIKLSGLALVGCAGRYAKVARHAAVDRHPTLVLHNANILTVDPERPRARAAAIWGDRFLDVGSDDAILALASRETRRVDLGGRTIVPGFIDAHSHPAYAGIRHLTRVDCDLRSIADIVDALRQRAASTSPGEWVLGFKYDDTKTREGRPITRADLDAVVSKHPVFIEHRGGHTGYLNSRGLEKAGVTERTPDPHGGHFDRDPQNGKLTGRVAERAKFDIDAAIPSSLHLGATPRRRQADLASHG